MHFFRHLILDYLIEYSIDAVPLSVAYVCVLYVCVYIYIYIYIKCILKSQL